MATGYFEPSKGETPESIRRKRDMIRALMGAQRSPQNVGEGLGALGDGIVAAILDSQADKAETAGRASANDAFNSATYFPAAPEMGAATPAPNKAVPPEQDVTLGSSVDFARGEASGPFDGDIRSGIIETAQALGLDPVDVATAISYETGGTFDPLKYGPTTQHGRHRGFIQFGEPQAAEHGVDWNNPIGSQLGANGAVASYLRKAGVKPGMGLLDIYSAINAGGVGLYDRSDANNGGAPGTVRDKVEKQMAGHRAKAMKLLGGSGGGAPVQVASLDPAAGVMEAGAEQGLGADNAGLQALAALAAKEGTEAAPLAQPGMVPPPGASPAAPAAQIAQALAGDAPEMAGKSGGRSSSAIIQQLMGAMGNQWLSEGQQQILKALLQQEMQKADPAYRIELEKAQIELDNLKNPKMSPSEKANYDLNVSKFGAEEAQRIWERQKADKEFGLDERRLTGEETDRTADNERDAARLKIEQDEAAGKAPATIEAFDPSTGQPVRMMWNAKAGRYEMVGGPKAPEEPKAPTVQSFYDNTGKEYKAQWNPQTKQWEMVGGTKAPTGFSLRTNADGTVEMVQGEGKLTENQSKLTLFQTLQTETQPVLLDLEKQWDPANIGDAAARSMPIAESYFKSEKGQIYDAAATAWAEGALRIATGAAATPEEMERTKKAYFAQVGDTPNTIAFKAQMREMYNRAIQRALGNKEVTGSLPKPSEFAKEQGGALADKPMSDYTDEELQEIIDGKR